MSTYCRITGKSRGLPKPHYFPLLPPISPADARRICRITGKSHGLPTHHFIPVLTASSRVRAKPCHITSKSEGHESHHYMPASEKHVVQKGFRYLAPLLETNVELMTILEGKHLDDKNHKFIYTVDENRCTLVLPGQLEAAVRDGDVRDIMLSKDSDKVLIKLRQGATIELDVKDYCTDGAADLFEGEGPSKDALVKRKKRKPNNDNSDWRRKIFEDKEKQAMSEEERLSEIKSKRIKVKLDAFREHPVFSSWKNVRVEPSEIQTDDQMDAQFKDVLQRLDGNQNLIDFVNVAGKPLVNTLPQPIKVESQIVDLSQSLPGIIQQPIVVGDSVTGFPVAKVVAPFRPFVGEIEPAIASALKEFNANKPILQNILQKQNTIQQKQASILPTLENVPGIVKSLCKLLEKGTKNGKNHKFEQGLKVQVGDVEKYVPGKFMKIDNKEIFVPGNVVETSTGPTFVPGLVLRTDRGTKFLPGFILKDEDNVPVFVAGQTALTRDGEKFVQGQVLQTNDGARFMPGQTILTPEGVNFIPGQIILDEKSENGHRFVPGQIIMTPEGPQFATGQFGQNPVSGEVTFVAGQSILNENCNWEFIPGQNMKTDDGGHLFVAGKEILDDEGCPHFVPGQVVIDEKNVERFVPGITVNDDDGNMHFIPGMEVETADGTKFVEGVMTMTDDGDLSFAAGKVLRTEKDTIEFNGAKNVDDLIFHDVHSGVPINSATVSSADGTEVFGHLVQSAQGVEFFPGEAAGLPAGKKIPGRLVKGKEMRFIPGTMIDGKFTPGQFVTTDAEEKFVPGQVIETNEGPKFVPGQVLQTRSGPKFVPGQTMETENGPKFIPGQIIETKRGPTFIPGQVIFTEEEGSRFVPGQVVDTVEGPRFVPGRVVETGDHVTFIPGQIIETEEGLKFIAPDLEDDPEGGYQFTVQGFEVAPEEVKMIGNSIPHACFIGEMAVDSKTLQQLAEAGMVVGRQLPVDIPSVNIRSLPVTEAACRIADSLKIDASQSVKMSHILSTLQQVKQAGVAFSPEEIGDNDLKALVYLALESEHDKESYEFLQMLGEALEDTIKVDENKIEAINSLHKLSAELAGKVREKSALIDKAANQLTTKLNMDSAYVQGKVGQILSNLEQIKKSDVFIPRKDVKDKNLKMLLSLVGDCDAKLVEPELLKALGNALENTIQVDPTHSLETIETLCNLTGDLVSKARAKTLPSIGAAHAMTRNLNVDAANAVKVNHILANLREIKNSNMAFDEAEVDDENLKVLLNLVQTCDGSNEDELIQAVASALENTVKLNPGHKLEAINKLHDLTIDLAAKAKKKSIFVGNAVKDMAKKFNVDEQNASKLNDVVTGLLKVKKSNESKLAKETDNVEMKALIDFVEENKNLNDEEFLKVLEERLESVVAMNPQNIDLLQSSTADIVSNMDKKVKLKSETALTMAGELEMTPEYLVKMTDILSNLQEIKKTGVAIDSGDLSNENLAILLNLADACDANKDDVTAIKNLGKTLENTLKVDLEQKLQTVDQLHALTTNLAGKTQAKAGQINEMASNIAEKIDVDEHQSKKIAQILSNLEQVKLSNVSLASECIEDKTLKALLQAVVTENGTLENAKFLEMASAAVGDILAGDIENKLETIQNLEKLTQGLATKVQDRSKKATESACMVANELDVSAPQLVKIGRILSNLQQIKQSNAAISSDGVKDGNLELLLDLAMACDEKKDDPEALKAFADVLEKTIKLDSANKLETIDNLDKLTTNLASELVKKSTLVKQTAETIADQVDVGEAQALQLSQILSNLQQIKLSNIELEENDLQDKDIRTLLNVVKKCKKGSKDADFLKTVGAALEEVIKQNPEQKFEKIKKLQQKSANLVSKARKKSKLTAETACKVANDLNVSTPQLVQLSHILSDLREIQNSGIAIPDELMKNESLELLLNLGLVCDTGKSDAEVMETLADVLQNTLQINPEQKVNTIETLHALTADVAKATQAKSKIIKQNVASIAKKYDLQPQSAKLNQILVNMQRICLSKLDIPTGDIADEHLKTFLNTVMKSNIDKDADGSKFAQLVTSALDEFIKHNIENKSLSIDILHKVTNDVAEKVRQQSLLTAETAMSVANDLNVGTPQLIKMSHILSNLQQIKQTDFIVSEEGMPNENLEVLMNLALASNNMASDSEVIETLANALQKTIQVDSANKIDTIEELHDLTSSLAAKAREKSNQFDQAASKIGTKLQLDQPYAAKLGHILANLQQMQISKIDVPKLAIKNENLKSLIQTALKCDAVDDAKFLQIIGNALENTLKKDKGDKLQNVDLLHSFTCEVISKKREQALLNVETAHAMSNELGLKKPQLIKINNILANVQQIQNSDLTLDSRKVENDNLRLLLDLALACTDKEKPEAVKILADAVLKTVTLNPEKTDNIVDQLEVLTKNLAEEARDKIVHKKNVAEAIKKKLDLTDEQAVKVEKILSNMQQIKLSRIDVKKEIIENKNIGQMLKTALKCDIEKGDEKYLTAVATILEQGISPDNLDELFDVTNTLASKARDSALLTAQTAYKMAGDLKVTTPELVKINQILSNVRKFKTANVVVPKTKVADDSLEMLLNLAMSEDSSSNPEVVKSLALALEKTLESGSGDVVSTIDNLYELTNDVVKVADEKTQILDKVAHKLAATLNVDEPQSVKIGDILSNLQQIKLANIDKAEIEKIEDKTVKKLFKAALKCNVLEGDDSLHFENMAQVLENIASLNPDVKFQVLDTLHDVTNSFTVQIRNKSKLNTEKAIDVANDLNLSTSHVVHVSRILSNLQQIKQANFMVPGTEGAHDENVELLINLALACNDEENEKEAVKIFAEALQKTLHLDSDNSQRTIEILNDSTALIASMASAECDLIDQAASQSTKNLNLDEIHSGKISQILSNVLRLKTSTIPINLEEIKDTSLRTLVEATINCEPENAGTDFIERAKEVLENLIAKNPENKIQNINNLQHLTNDLVTKVNTKALVTTETAYDVANELNSSAPQVMKMSRIISNLQELKKVDFVPESLLGDESLELLTNLALASKDEKGEVSVIKSLGDALKKTAKIGDVDTAVNTLHQLTTDLTSFAKEKLQLIEETSTKIADKCDLDETRTEKLKKILTDVQRIKLSKVDLAKADIKDEKLKALLSDIIDSDIATGPDSIQAVGEAIQKILASDLERKDYNVDSLFSIVDNIAGKAREQALLTTETAYEMGEELNMNTSQLVKLGHILSDLRDIKQSHAAIPMNAIEDDNLEILLNLALPCDASKPDKQTVKTLASILKNTINIDSEQKVQTVDSLHALTAELAQDARVKSKLANEKATEMARNLNIGETYSVKLCEILSNLQQIKLSDVDISQHNIKNENWKTLIDFVLQTENNLENGQFYQLLGSEIEKMIRADPEHKLQNINSLHAVLNGIMTKENNKNYLVANTAYNMAKELNVNTPNLMKISHILSDLQDVTQANVAIPQNEIKDEKLQVLLNLAKACDSKKGDAEAMEALSKALKSTIQVDGAENVLVIDELQSLTAELSANAQEKVAKVKEISSNIATTLGLDDSKAVKLAQILSDVQQLAVSSLNLEKENIQNCEIEKLLKFTTHNCDQGDLEKVADAVENFLKHDSNHVSRNLDELHACVANLSSKAKNKSLLLTENALEVANQLNLGTADIVKMAEILSNVQSMKEAGVALPLNEVKDDNLKLLLNLAQGCEGQTSETDYVEKLKKVLENTVKMDLDRKGQTVEELFTLTSNLATKVDEKAQVFKKTGQQLAKKLDVDQATSIKLTETLSNLQRIAQAEIDISQNVYDENLTTLLKIAKECVGKKDEEFVKIVGGTLENTLTTNLYFKLDNIENLHRLTTELAVKVTRNTLQAASTAQEVASSLQLDVAQAVKMNDVLLNLQNLRQLNVPLDVQHIQNEDVKLLVNLALACDAESDNPCDFVPTLGQALEKIMELQPELRSKTIELLHSTAVELVDKASEVSALVNNTTTKIAKKLKIDQPSVKKIYSILTGLLSIKQANIEIPEEYLKDKNLQILLSAIEELESDFENAELLRLVGDALENIIKVDLDHKSLNIDILHASVSDLSSYAQSKTFSQAGMACQVAKHLQINESSAVKINHVISDLKRLKNMQAFISNADIEDQNLKLLFNQALACDDDVENPELLQTLADALESTIKVDKTHKSESINKLQAMTAQLVSVAQSRSAQIEKIASKLAGKLKVNSTKVGRILSNLQQIRRSSLFVSMEEIPDKDARTLILFALENENDDVAFFEAVGELLEKIIKANPQHKSQTVNSLCAITSDLATGTRDRTLLIAETAHSIAKSIDTNSSSINVSHILSNLQQIKLSNIAVSSNEVEDEDVKLLLNLTLAYDGDVDAPEFLQTIGHALKNTVLLNPKKTAETMAKLHLLTDDLSSKVTDRSSAIKEVSSRVADKLEIENSVISDILSNLKEIQLGNLASFENIEDEDLKALLNLASESGYDFEDVQFLNAMGDAIENIIQMDLDHKSQKINALHALTSDLASSAREKALLITSTANKMADKLNLDSSHSVKISRILNNLREISESGVIPTSDSMTDKNLELLLKQASNTECTKREGQFLSQLGQTLEKLITADPKRKVEIINSLQTLTGKVLTEIREQPPNKVQLLRSLIKNNLELKDDIVEKLSSILDENEMTMCVAFRNMSRENPDFVGKVLRHAAAILNDKTIDEKKAVETLHRAIVRAVGETSEQEVTQVLHQKRGEDFRSLVVDASGLAKALGMNEVVHVLDVILQDSRSMPMLAKDKIVMEVLKRLTVMRQLAEKQPTLRAALHDLQYDPYAARNDPRLRALVRDSAVLMVIPEESLILRSSADIPTSLLFNDNTLAVEDFMVKSRQTGKTFLILKKGVQMVVPREAARDVLTGKVPYTVLDENGIHHFTPLHVFNALKLPRVATNRFSNYGYSPKISSKVKAKGDASEEELLYSRCGSVGVEESRKNFPSSSCSTQEAIASRDSAPMKRMYSESSYRC